MQQDIQITCKQVVDKGLRVDGRPVAGVEAQRHRRAARANMTAAGRSALGLPAQQHDEVAVAQPGLCCGGPMRGAG